MTTGTDRFQIISSENSAYRNIIKKQQVGNFSKNCHSCPISLSIYDNRPSAQDDSLVNISLDTALDLRVVK